MKGLKSFVLGAAMVLAAAATAVVSPAQAATGSKPVALIPTKNTVSFYEGVTSEGVTRSVLFIRPSTLPSGKAPAIVMLHGLDGSPEDLANNAKAGNLAAQMGYWVILPPMVDNQWNATIGNNTGIDDVGFLKTLIQTAVAQYPIDATRVSMAGMSDGAFMTVRMACEQPQLLASATAVAGELLTDEASACHPTRAVPTIFMMGTADPIVSYNGDSQFYGAPKTFNIASGLGVCNSGQAVTEPLPVIVKDGTTVSLLHNASCSTHGEVDLYTIYNGGHAWPGGTNKNTGHGITTGNLNATTTLGNFAKLWTNQSTT